MVFDLGIYQLDIDVEQTANFYSNADGILCNCDGCRNYAEAIKSLSPKVYTFFHQFGIDPVKPAEIYVNYAPSKETVDYGGFYHVCGTILKGTNPWLQIDKSHFQLDTQYRFKISDNFSVFINNEVHLLEDDFPTPAIQIEIEFILPGY